MADAQLVHQAYFLGQVKHGGLLGEHVCLEDDDARWLVGS